ncbi:malate synthase G [Pelagibacterium flavum]|uniref:Malate synthase G n=1 Tax=Pelagibacterium flavum TaxID=2984530 RepID=A0ABY6IRL1_9HYPH|nr:malate synthase G [Pelagibacterium sp. YIM 151497]UYQ73261.1 malate synthase G [Pelagibacterium sp. YIM 151497]
MSSYVTRAGLQVDEQLAAFVEQEALNGLDIASDSFWAGFAEMVAAYMPGNRELLEIRDRMQNQIDDWHRDNGPATKDPEAYQAFLREIKYLEDEPEDFRIETEDLDSEIASICGPQLVVPVSNARYALNAANARWGSLYDALYGTDVIAREGDLAPGRAYNPRRGAEVFARAGHFLDETFPLLGVKHWAVTRYGVDTSGDIARLVIESQDGPAKLAYPEAFAGYSRHGDVLRILLKHHGLHVELVIDANHPVGKDHPANLADVVIESALTTIQDCEDSVAAVDAEDKVGVYRNWLGLMKGDLADTFEKGGKSVTRTLNADRAYTAPDGSELTLKGRALLLVRNVGHLMTTDAILDADGQPIGEGMMDAAITTLCALHDLKRRANSTTGSIYIVKPKMHGPTEVLFACNVFGEVEKILGLPLNTIKIGIMDEERRTSANLKACIHAARERVFFINTGFLDRTGDEIHTSMEAGPVLLKDQIKAERWIQAYEDRNVTIGIACGLTGRAQIGKGMWARPDDMAAMMEQKVGHPKSGANCAWVPSPTAATLHALHYHEVDVFEAQKRRHNEPIPGLDALFSMPVLDPSTLSAEQIQRELDNNAQGILGYVVRWVDAGVGCSKVPDINDVGLMEDRATCRISSQAIANWLWHGVVTQDEVVATFTRMARVVDQQNAGDPAYDPMSDDPEHSVAFQAALALALEGVEQPSGYTEPLLHAKRAEKKAQR